MIGKEFDPQSNQERRSVFHPFELSETNVLKVSRNYNRNKRRFISRQEEIMQGDIQGEALLLQIGARSRLSDEIGGTMYSEGVMVMDAIIRNHYGIKLLPPITEEVLTNNVKALLIFHMQYKIPGDPITLATYYYEYQMLKDKEPALKLYLPEETETHEDNLQFIAGSTDAYFIYHTAEQYDQVERQKKLKNDYQK